MKNLIQIDWRQQYEDVRREALRVDSRRGHGLALFLSRGMMAWLEALTALKPRAGLPAMTREAVDLPSILRPDLTTLLANMVLSCMRGGAHEYIP
jgi:hypothetical protein